MFDEMIAQIREDTARGILTVQIRRSEGQPQREQVAKPDEYNGGDGSLAKKPMRGGQKVGRNDPCPCGSGKKYKKCCGR